MGMLFDAMPFLSALPKIGAGIWGALNRPKPLDFGRRQTPGTNRPTFTPRGVNTSALGIDSKQPTPSSMSLQDLYTTGLEGAEQELGALQRTRGRQEEATGEYRVGLEKALGGLSESRGEAKDTLNRSLGDIQRERISIGREAATADQRMAATIEDANRTLGRVRADYATAMENFRASAAETEGAMFDDVARRTSQISDTIGSQLDDQLKQIDDMAFQGDVTPGQVAGFKVQARMGAFQQLGEVQGEFMRGASERLLSIKTNNQGLLNQLQATGMQVIAGTEATTLGTVSGARELNVQVRNAYQQQKTALTQLATNTREQYRATATALDLETARLRAAGEENLALMKSSWAEPYVNLYGLSQEIFQQSVDLDLAEQGLKNQYIAGIQSDIGMVGEGVNQGFNTYMTQAQFAAQQAQARRSNRNQLIGAGMQAGGAVVGGMASGGTGFFANPGANTGGVTDPKFGN